MEYATLGSTDLRISRVAFGAGPIPQLMTGDAGQLQRATVLKQKDYNKWERSLQGGKYPNLDRGDEFLNSLEGTEIGGKHSNAL